MTVTIRAATACDAAAIASLLAQLGYPRSDVSTAQLLAAAQKQLDQIVLVASENDVVIGFAALTYFYYFHTDQRLARLSSLAVDETMRSHGMGEALLNAAERWARDNHCQVLELASNIKRVDAHRFYERLAYNKTGWRLWKAIPQ